MALRAASRRQTRSVTIEREIKAVTVQDDVPDVALHCADLEACLEALQCHKSSRSKSIDDPKSPDRLRDRLEATLKKMSSKFNLVETSLVEIPRVFDVHNIDVTPFVQVEEVIRPCPRVTLQERVKKVPKIQVQVVERIVEVPEVQYVQKIVEVPQIQLVEKLVEVPQIRVREVLKHVPRVQVQEIIRHVPIVEEQEVVRTVPRYEVQVVENIVELPAIGQSFHQVLQSSETEPEGRVAVQVESRSAPPIELESTVGAAQASCLTPASLCVQKSLAQGPWREITAASVPSPAVASTALPHLSPFVGKGEGPLRSQAARPPLARTSTIGRPRPRSQTAASVASPSTGHAGPARSSSVTTLVGGVVAPAPGSHDALPTQAGNPPVMATILSTGMPGPVRHGEVFR